MIVTPPKTTTVNLEVKECVHLSVWSTYDKCWDFVLYNWHLSREWDTRNSNNNALKKKVKYIEIV